MPLIEPSSYRPPARLWNGHLQTIVPSLFRRVTVNYLRERLETPDDDFLDLDWAFALVGSRQLAVAPVPTANRPLPTKDCPLVILSHGLEGDSSRPYVAGMVRHLTQHGFDCLAWNFRSCSGEMNRQLRFYHSGATDDLNYVVQFAIGKGYKNISLIGYSLGGNLTLKYIGERGHALPGEVKKAVAFSVPLDLAASSVMIDRGFSRVYLRRFLRHLQAKVVGKEKLFPEKISSKDYRRVRTFADFDDRYTAPLHGFRNAQDYYQQNSSIRFLRGIAIPTLIINAKNDPLLAPECYPENLARELPNVYMEFPEQGGHCGFPSSDPVNGVYWSEQRALAFLTS
ncbi:alpha/beta fold hydrolase [Nibrella saemangeumensis]|uniref:Alpha/beta fold hydrolase n=1 Tax=Nibrella saemangeumensis TaxID=1084526 RepID=A0ABP8MLR4_9BACT